MIAYADSSALVKLVLKEPESAQLLTHLQTYDGVVSSALAAIEVTRAAQRAGGTPAAERASAVLMRIALLAIDRAVVRRASALPPLVLRSLDAIHLASALEVPDQVTLIAYDRRLIAAAADLGLPTVSPVAPST